MCATCIVRHDQGKDAHFGCITDKMDTVLACAECHALGGSQACAFNRSELVNEAEADIGSRLSKLKGLLVALDLMLDNNSKLCSLSTESRRQIRLISQMALQRLSSKPAERKSRRFVSVIRR